MPTTRDRSSPLPHPRSSRSIGQISSSAYWAKTANAWVEKAATNVGLASGGSFGTLESVAGALVGVRNVGRSTVAGTDRLEHDEHHDARSAG